MIKENVIRTVSDYLFDNRWIRSETIAEDDVTPPLYGLRSSDRTPVRDSVW